MSMQRFRGTIILPHRLLPRGEVDVQGGRIVAVHEMVQDIPSGADIKLIRLAGGYLAPGFVNLHVRGGAGADFMDGTEAAFRTVC
jgi:N-acetylglucosamine-6-phosphate deacetylase